jgi:hypothetical protein
MLPWPTSRISGLIEKMEQGVDPTPDELKRIERLQALDIAKFGEDFLKQAITDQDAADSQLVL